MDDFKSSDLDLFRHYLLDLQQLPEDGSKDYKIYKRWESDIEQIQIVANRILKFLYENGDPVKSQQVDYKINSRVRDEYMVFKEYVLYFLAGIQDLEKFTEQKLISVGLLDKKIQEMTGYEFKALLLTTLKEHQDRQQQ